MIETRQKTHNNKQKLLRNIEKRQRACREQGQQADKAARGFPGGQRGHPHGKQTV